jgi:hypothetical protein
MSSLAFDPAQIPRTALNSYVRHTEHTCKDFLKPSPPSVQLSGENQKISVAKKGETFSTELEELTAERKILALNFARRH